MNDDSQNPNPQDPASPNMEPPQASASPENLAETAPEPSSEPALETPADVPEPPSGPELVPETTPENPAPTAQPLPISSQAAAPKPKKSKKLILIISAIVAVIAVVVAAILIHEHLENQRLDAESVLLKSDLTVEFGNPLKVSDCLASLQGELVSDFDINTEQLGEQEVNFEYTNIKNRKRPSKFTINVVDTGKPTVFGGNTYTLYTGYEGELTDLMMSVDDIDDRPIREIRGDYNLNKPGSYKVEYVITDASGNQTVKPFTLNIVDPPEDSGNEPDTPPTELTSISRIIRLHKTERTKVGIDVSQWQGKIDWKKVKDSGVEFAMIRLGYQYGFGGENIVDPQFEANLAGAKANQLPVGVYFYSYARTPDEAKAQAEWIVELLGGAELELGIAFDWESWATFNSARMSLYTINKTAETFLSVVKSADYKPVLYSSKNYLELIWRPDQLATKFDDFDVWLAQYYDYVTYRGDYLIWQMTDSGSVPGIDGAVDIDIMYK